MLAGKLQGKAVDLITVFEGVGASQGQKDDRRRIEATGRSRLPGLRFLLRHVHGQFHELRYGSIGSGFTRPWNNSGGTGFPSPAGKTRRDENNDSDEKGNPAARYMYAATAFKNAIAVDMALGCSTNTVLHIPAIAHEAGIKLDLNLFNKISEKTPNLCKLSPAGHHHIEDLDMAGGIQAVMKVISALGVIDEKTITVTGKTIGANLKGARVLNTDVIRPLKNALLPAWWYRGFTRQPRTRWWGGETISGRAGHAGKRR